MEVRGEIKETRRGDGGGEGEKRGIGGMMRNEGRKESEEDKIKGGGEWEGIRGGGKGKEK